MKTRFQISEMRDAMSLAPQGEVDYYLQRIESGNRFLVFGSSGVAMNQKRTRILSSYSSFAGASKFFDGWRRESPHVVYASPSGECLIVETTDYKLSDEAKKNRLELMRSGVISATEEQIKKLKDELFPPPATVYLAGPINGCTDGECKDWRESAKAVLPNTIDPMVRDYRGREDECYKEIVDRDKEDIRKCGVMLVNYEKPSVGTSMEIFFAHSLRKPVYVVAKPGVTISPWLKYHATAVVHTFAEAFDLCLKGPSQKQYPWQ